ncbi:hypothetical protein Gpo141_00007664 [Globisporangium polare]
MAAPSPAQDEKSAMNFVDDAIDLDCLDWGGSSGPPTSILQAPAAATSSPGSPPLSSSSPSKQAPSLRANNYRAFQSSGSLAPGSLVPGSSSGSPSSRKLPEIALDLSSSLPSGSSPPTGMSSSSGHFGVSGGVSLPSPSSSSSSHQSEPKKKPFLMASLAIGLNEVIPGNDEEDDNDDDQGPIQPNASPGRSPKKFQLGLSQKSPTYALAPSPKNGGTPTGGNGSKLMPISLGGGSGGSGGGGGNSHAMLKFDPIMGGGGGSSRNLDLEAGAKSQHADPPCSYRKTIASRSPLRDRSILENVSDSSDFMAGASPKSSASSFSSSLPSKLDPLETESIRGSTLASSSGTSSSAFPSERKSMKLPSSSSSPLQHSPEKAQQSEQKQSDSKTTTTASPDKPPAAQPKFRNLFKKNPTTTGGALGDKSQKGTPAQDDDIDLLGDAHHSSMAQGPVPALTPMDEFNYLSFSPRSGGKQTARDLPSLSLSSDAKDSGASGGNSAKQQAAPPAATPSPKKTKKLKDKQPQQETEQAK